MPASDWPRSVGSSTSPSRCPGCIPFLRRAV
jgi:hypothetical protein